MHCYGLRQCLFYAIFHTRFSHISQSHTIPIGIFGWIIFLFREVFSFCMETCCMIAWLMHVYVVHIMCMKYIQTFTQTQTQTQAQAKAQAHTSTHASIWCVRERICLHVAFILPILSFTSHKHAQQWPCTIIHHVCFLLSAYDIESFYECSAYINCWKKEHSCFSCAMRLCFVVNAFSTSFALQHICSNIFHLLWAMNWSIPLLPLGSSLHVNDQKALPN